jgi:hypothetical protein
MTTILEGVRRRLAPAFEQFSVTAIEPAEMLAPYDGSLEPGLRCPHRDHIAAGSGSDDEDVKFHSVCIAAFAACCAFWPRARALKVLELTRSSRSMMSFRLSLGMPWVMKTIRVR